MVIANKIDIKGESPEYCDEFASNFFEAINF